MSSLTTSAHPQRDGAGELWDTWEQDLSDLNYQCMGTQEKILGLYNARTIRTQSATNRVLVASLKVHLDYSKAGTFKVPGKIHMPPEIKSDQDYIYHAWQRYTNLCEQGQQLYELHLAKKGDYHPLRGQVDLMKQRLEILQNDLLHYESLLEEAKASFGRGPLPPKLFDPVAGDGQNVSGDSASNPIEVGTPSAEVGVSGSTRLEIKRPKPSDKESGDRTCWYGGHLCYAMQNPSLGIPETETETAVPDTSSNALSDPAPGPDIPAPGDGSPTNKNGTIRKSPPTFLKSKRPNPTNDTGGYVPLTTVTISSDDDELPEPRNYPPVPQPSPSINLGNFGNGPRQPQNTTKQTDKPIPNPPLAEGLAPYKSAPFPRTIPAPLKKQQPLPPIPLTRQSQNKPRQPQTTKTYTENPLLTPPFNGDYDSYVLAPSPKKVPIPSNNQQPQQPQQGPQNPTNKPRPNNTSKYVTPAKKILQDMGYEPGTGLGAQGTGITSPIEIIGPDSKGKRTGLGYNGVHTNNNNNHTTHSHRPNNSFPPASPDYHADNETGLDKIIGSKYPSSQGRNKSRTKGGQRNQNNGQKEKLWNKPVIFVHGGANTTRYNNTNTNKNARINNDRFQAWKERTKNIGVHPSNSNGEAGTNNSNSNHNHNHNHNHNNNNKNNTGHNGTGNLGKNKNWGRQGGGGTNNTQHGGNDYNNSNHNNNHNSSNRDGRNNNRHGKRYVLANYW